MLEMAPFRLNRGAQILPPLCDTIPSPKVATPFILAGTISPSAKSETKAHNINIHVWRLPFCCRQSNGSDGHPSLAMLCPSAIARANNI